MTDSDQKLAVMQFQLNEMYLRLLGNGQPGSGEIEKLHTRLSTMGDRVAALEKFRWIVTGAAFGAGLIVGRQVSLLF